MNVEVQNVFRKQCQKDALTMPNHVPNLIQDPGVSASRLSFGFDLTFELCDLKFMGSDDAFHC